MYKYAFSFIFIFIIFSSKAQTVKRGLWNEYETVRKKNQKPTIVFVHTDWCSFCKIQQKKIAKDKELIQLLNENVYYLELNAEKEKQPIYFWKRNYNFIQNGTSGIHELAIHLSPQGQRPAYPLWVIIDDKGQTIFRHEGFLKTSILKEILSKALTIE